MGWFGRPAQRHEIEAVRGQGTRSKTRAPCPYNGRTALAPRHWAPGRHDRRAAARGASVREADSRLRSAAAGAAADRRRHRRRSRRGSPPTATPQQRACESARAHAGCCRRMRASVLRAQVRAGTCRRYCRRNPRRRRTVGVRARPCLSVFVCVLRRAAASRVPSGASGLR